MNEESENLEESSKEKSEESLSEELSAEASQSIELGQSSGIKSKLILFFCIIVVGLAILFQRFKSNEGQAGEHIVNLDQESSEVNQEELGFIRDGSDVMIYLKKIQARPQNQGEAWDVDDSGPDLYYQIFWNKNKIYESEIKEDALVADWIPIGMSVKDSILKGRINVDQAIDLPIVAFASDRSGGEEIVIKVFDSDSLSGDDEVGEVKIQLKQLKLGDNTIDLSQRENLGLVELDLRIIDNALSTDEKIQAIMKGQ